MSKPCQNLTERLASSQCVLTASGYIFECERRGYLQAGAFVPEVVLDHPEIVECMHREFVHAGSDVVLAMTCCTCREKMTMINRENATERINRTALRIARKVADETKTLMAASLCATTVYNPTDRKTDECVMAMFKEQVEWAVAERCDFIVAENMYDFGEAKLALDAIKKCDKEMPAVILLSPTKTMKTRDNMSYAEACKKLEDAGADCVGLSGCSGPSIMIEMMKEIRKTCKGPLACVPVAYRCTKECPQVQSLMLPETNKRAFPNNLDFFLCSCDQIAEFGKACKEMNIQFVGLCCGNSPRYFRSLSESLGRKPAASRYSPDMTKHFIFGDAKNPNMHDFNMSLRTMFGCK